MFKRHRCVFVIREGYSLPPIQTNVLSFYKLALAAGSEIHLAELRRTRQAVTWITFGICFFTWTFVYLAFLIFSPVAYLKMGDGAAPSPAKVLAMASLTASMMIARSPASCVAVLRELNAHGPFSSLVLAVTVVKDAVVVALFSINIELCRLAFRPDTGAANSGFGTFLMFLRPVLLVALSTSVGLIAGLGLSPFTSLFKSAVRC